MKELLKCNFKKLNLLTHFYEELLNLTLRPVCVYVNVCMRVSMWHHCEYA